jgi:YfiH family protein
MASAAAVLQVDLGVDLGAWFTGAHLDGAADANLAHHRPHVPARLAQARDMAARHTGTDPSRWHLMRQVHGASVATVDERTPVGAELRGVDVLVTRMVERPLVVLSADCIPLLAAGGAAIGAAHAGWRGLRADVPAALVAALGELGERPRDIRVVLGPAIGPCCYEVGPEVVDAIAAIDAHAVTTTTAGAPSVDLRAAARTRLHELGVVDVADATVGSSPAGEVPEGADRATSRPSGPTTPPCTACDGRWFSHRRDPAAGRQAGIVVRHGSESGTTHRRSGRGGLA